MADNVLSPDLPEDSGEAEHCFRKYAERVFGSSWNAKEPSSLTEAQRRAQLRRGQGRPAGVAPPAVGGRVVPFPAPNAVAAI
jgi:hypothetical protein